MTDAPQPPDTTVPDPPKVKKPFLIPFHADIQVASPMRVVDGGIELSIEDQLVVVPVTEEQRLKLQQQPPEPDRPQRVSLWFRTTEEEGRVQDLKCFSFSLLRGERAKSEVPNKPQFSVGAALKEVNREEGLIVVQVRPNPTGKLLEPFDVHIRAAPEFFNRYFSADQTYLIHGQYDPLSGHLIATAMRPMTIGQPLSPGNTKRKAPPEKSAKSKKWKGKKWKERKAQASGPDGEAASTSEPEQTPTSVES